MIQRTVRHALLGLLVASAGYLVLLAYPQPLFAYELTHAGITVHADTPIPDTMRGTLERVRARLDRSPLTERRTAPQVFICSAPWRFALFARQNYRVGGVAEGFVGQHVFLRESDMHGRPPDWPVRSAGCRGSAAVVLHRARADAHRDGASGRTAHYARLPQWVDDGYADYIARDIDLKSMRWRS